MSRKTKASPDEKIERAKARLSTRAGRDTAMKALVPLIATAVEQRRFEDAHALVDLVRDIAALDQSAAKEL